MKESPSRYRYTPNAERAWRRRAWGIVRAVGTLVFVVIVLGSVEWREFPETLRRTHLTFLALSVAITPVLVATSALKLSVLLKSKEIDAGFLYCFRLSLVGMFFNQLLPTSVGGDVVRISILREKTARLSDAAAAVIVERLTGLTVLVAFTLAVLPFAPASLWNPWTIALVPVMLGGYGILLWLLADRRPLLWLSSRFRGAARIGRLAEALDVYRSARSALWYCAAVSLVFQILAAANVLLSALAFRAALSFPEALVASPVIQWFALVPVTIGGIGIAEWGYLIIMSAFGVPSSPAVSTALLIRAKSALAGAAGGLVHLGMGVARPARGSRDEE